METDKAYTRFGTDESLPSPVVSLTIIDVKTIQEGKVTPTTKLLGVVRSGDTNRKHPDVVSVPTQRIPLQLFHAAIDRLPVKNRIGQLTFFHPTPVSSTTTSGHTPLIYITESVLSRKLGLSNALERDEVHFTAAARVIQSGKSYHPNLPPEDGMIEHIDMLNIQVSIEKGVDLLPAQTASYSHIFWTSAAQFIQAVQDKDLIQLDAGLDPVAYCIHGLCISSTYSILAVEQGLDPYIDFFV